MLPEFWNRVEGTHMLLKERREEGKYFSLAFPEIGSSRIMSNVSMGKTSLHLEFHT